VVRCATHAQGHPLGAGDRARARRSGSVGRCERPPADEGGRAGLRAARHRRPLRGPGADARNTGHDNSARERRQSGRRSRRTRRMSRDVTTAAAPRGRPRSEKAQNAILEAAAELLLEQGLAAVSMDAVAARAGVSKATIYRWWPTKETLALDALFHEWETAPTLPNTGSLRGDLLALLRPWVRRLRSRPYGRVIAALLAEAHADPAFGEQYRA